MTKSVRFGFFAAHLVAIRTVQGRLGELEALLADVAAQHPNQWGWQAALALCHCEHDRRIEA